MRSSITSFLSVAVIASFASADDKLLGTTPPEWQLEQWQHSKPLALKDLKGKVVLVRWWTAGGCPFCAATAPALNEFHERYQGQGLVVIGVYHHKGAQPLAEGEVEEAARKLGFKFPVAVDPIQGNAAPPQSWRTLRKWWLEGGAREFTSVSFLLDRQGRIRHIHPGGQYVKGDQDYEAMKARIEELLKEKG
jgi:peroxiredoxin